MRLDFGGEDAWTDEADAAYAQTYEELVERFERWLADGPLGEGEGDDDPAWMAANAGIALNWKRSYADGLLAFWPLSDAYEFLVEWVPRKVSTDADGGEAIADSLAWFVDFLDGEALLADGSASPDEMTAFVHARRAELRAAMEDPSNFGMAKSALGGGRPVTIEHADDTAAELLVATDSFTYLRFMTELEAWRANRTPEDAAAQLADAMLELDDPALQNLALAIMGDGEVTVAEPQVRRVAATEPATDARRRAVAFARTWLVDHDLEDPSSLYDADDLDSFIDILVARIATSGPDGLVETFSLAGDRTAQLDLLERLWRIPSPMALVALSGIGKVHPDKPTAKAARKAAHKWETTNRAR